MKMKFKVRDEAHSAAIQTALFAIGYVWNGEKTSRVQLLEADHLYVGSFGADTITQGGDSEYFSRQSHLEYELVDGQLVPLGTKPVKPVVVRTPDEVRADRRKELLDGVVAYHSAGKEVPQDWLTELVHGPRF